MAPRRALIALLAFCPRASAAQGVEAPEVALRLIAGCEVLAGGEEFEVGAHLRVPPGWHIYWENPGDAGAATSVTLKGPAGFKIQGPLYPGPQRNQGPEGLTSYTYEGDTVIFFRVTAPRVLPPGPYAFRAQADWLVSAEQSFPGHGDARIELERGRQTRETAGDDASLLAYQRLLLPQPLKQLGRVHQNWRLACADTGEGARMALELGINGVDRLSFCPARSEQLRVTAETFELGNKEARLGLEFEWFPERPDDRPRVRGVLRVERGLELAFYTVDLRSRDT